MKKINIKSLVKSQPKELEVNPAIPVNEYYIDLANKFKTAKYAVLIFLVVFVLCMITVFRTDITLENCKYLVRFFSSGASVYQNSYDPIYYDTAGVIDIKLFNSNLVTIKNDGVDFYDMKGNNTESYNINYVDPTVVTRGKHMLVYDLGGNSFELFNNFSRLAGETYSYPISCAAVSNDGMFAVVTKSLDYQSVVHLYDHNYNLITEISKNKYITDIKINAKGDKLLLTCAYAKDGRYISEVVSYVPYTEKESGSCVLENSFVILCGFHDNGSYSVLSDNALMFFNSKDKKIAEYPLGNIVPNDCLILGDKVVLSYNKNIVGSQSEIMIFSTKGEQLYTIPVEDKIFDSVCFGEDLYLLLDNKIAYINLDNGKTKTCEIESGANGLYICDKTELVIGYSNMARAYLIEDLFSKVKED